MADTDKGVQPESISTDVHEYVSAPLDAIPPDVSLPYPLYIKVAGQFVLFRAQGDILSGTRFQTLALQKVDCVFIPKADWLRFLSMMDQVKIEDVGEGPDSEVVINRIRSLLVVYGKTLEEQKEMQKASFLKLKELGERLAEGMSRTPALATKLLRRYGDASLYYANHSINVAVYSCAVALRLRLPLNDVKLLTFACLVHNVGNIFLPQQLLYKTSEFTKEEWDQMKKHPALGAKLLEEFKAPKEVILVAKQHHEEMNGQGYPIGLSGLEIHLFSRICHIADFFDACTGKKPYGVQLTPQEAVAKLREGHGRFDSKIVNLVSSVEKST